MHCWDGGRARKNLTVDEKAQVQSPEGKMSFKEPNFKEGLKNHRLTKMSGGSGHMEVFVQAKLNMAHAFGNESIFLVLFSHSQDLWYLNADAFQYSCRMCWPTVYGTTDVPQWVDTIKPFDHRLSEYSESPLMAQSGGTGKHTKQLVGFVLHVKTDKCDKG